MDEYFAANRRHWDELVPIHAGSSYYDAASFKAGQSKLKPVEREELGDVRGKTLLHLQCHFGLDTLSWAREGAIVTGADFSPKAIEAARALAAETATDARFVLSDLYSLPDRLDGQFDIVFTSYGALCWLPDLGRWAQVIAHFLKPGGVFYAVEFHAMAGTLEWGDQVQDLDVRYPYFPITEPLRFDDDGSYADRQARLENRVTYSWPHPPGEVVTTLAEAGLRIEFLHEFPFSIERFFPFMEERADGMLHLTKYDGSIPLMYSVKATKPPIVRSS
ncbi:MAG: methyltransferase domain-containing protein [Dehalococcoidia bacterium]|nr:methyltransferase domain-containing protein [Dehalococcoidia bacterium]